MSEKQQKTQKNVYVLKPNGIAEKIRIKDSMMVDEFETMIAQLVETTSDNLKISVKGEEIPKQKGLKIKHTNIREGSFLHLGEKRVNNPMKKSLNFLQRSACAESRQSHVSVKFKLQTEQKQSPNLLDIHSLTESDQITLELDKQASIREIKGILAKKFNNNNAEFQLFFRQQELKDSYTLEYYNYNKKSIIKLKVKGGGETNMLLKPKLAESQQISEGLQAEESNLYARRGSQCLTQKSIKGKQNDSTNIHHSEYFERKVLKIKNKGVKSNLIGKSYSHSQYKSSSHKEELSLLNNKQIIETESLCDEPSESEFQQLHIQVQNQQQTHFLICENKDTRIKNVKDKVQSLNRGKSIEFLDFVEEEYQIRLLDIARMEHTSCLHLQYRFIQPQ